MFNWIKHTKAALKGKCSRRKRQGSNSDTMDQDTIDASGNGVEQLDAKYDLNTAVTAAGNGLSQLGHLNCDADSPFYSMSRKPIGKCLIFNLETFHPSQNLAQRPGSSVDGENFRKCFQELGFEVSEFKDEDCTYKQLIAALNAVAQQSHANYDCLVVAVMTHGERGYLRAYDHEMRVDELFIPFQKCPTLHGKPKLFFIQACRGTYLDQGQMMYKDVTDNVSFFKIPTWSDFLIAYSTVEGYYSWRHVSRGSWFIQAIVSVFRERAKYDDLMTMMAAVNRKVSYEFTSNNPRDATFHEKKQVPCITTMLTRLLYFHGPPVAQMEITQPISL